MANAVAPAYMGVWSYARSGVYNQGAKEAKPPEDESNFNIK